ncbi:MAG TPA: RHS repeat-associated core domain-containing protein, partial [Pyrinomonadaceae bacterium]|nr:RHS repeat-associated core domain-containing protein [Pyrinomonadaceae bacterium]
DATGQQTYASATGLIQYYDGDRLRTRKTESGVDTYYLRSTVLGGQVVAELNSSGAWSRGYVYLSGQLIAIQSNGVNWVHQDPVTKSQRVTNSSGSVVSTIDLDPWGGETGRSSNQAFQPQRYTSYTRDGNGGDDAMHRRYQVNWSRFAQPDPYDGSYNLSDPQSFNRYAYVQNDPVNFTDPSGLMPCGVEFSYSECGGGGGFWGSGGGFGGHVAEYNREYGGLSRNVASGMQSHNEQMYNAMGGYGYLTNAQVRQIQARAFVVDPITGELVSAGSAVWVEDIPWDQRGILKHIGDYSRAVANRVTLGWVNRVHESRGEPTPDSAAYRFGDRSGEVFLVLATRGRNRVAPVPGAVGPHSALKFGPGGNITGYSTFRPNPRNPTGFDLFKRFDLTGGPHRGIPTPHVHRPGIPGGVRPARGNEIPR